MPKSRQRAKARRKRYNDLQLRQAIKRRHRKFMQDPINKLTIEAARVAATDDKGEGK